ncbi:MAG: glycosyltransferase family 4 protein [Halobacteriota archaeon]
MDAIYPYNMGGADKRLWELARKLAENGEHDVHIYGMKWWDGDDVIVTDNVVLHGVCDVYELYSDSGVRSIKEAMVFSLKVLPHLLKDEYDIIDCNQFPYFPCISGKIASMVKRKPLVITWLEVWDDYWYDYLGKTGGTIGKLVEKFTMRLSDGIVAVSNKTRDDLIRCGVRPERVEVVPVGIDLERIMRIAPSNDKADILFAGRLIYEKRIDVLIEAIALLKKELPAVTCRIIGDGPERENLQTLVRRLSLNDNVEFMGFIDQDGLIGYMKSSKAFVLPSVREGFGLVIVEANACKLPVVSIRHDMSAVSELIRDGVSGFLVNELSADKIAQVVLPLITNDLLRQRLAETGYELSRKYGWSDVSKRVIDIYQGLLNKS